jgi:hypothetical protein
MGGFNRLLHMHVTLLPNDYAVILQQNGGAANLRTLDWA